MPPSSSLVRVRRLASLLKLVWLAWPTLAIWLKSIAERTMEPSTKLVLSAINLATLATLTVPSMVMVPVLLIGISATSLSAVVLLRILLI